MKVVVTGASGNVGTALLERLLAGGHEVVGISRRRPGPEHPYDQVRWVNLDVASPSERGRLKEAFQGADAVVHLAWLIQPARVVQELVRVNVGGTRAVVEAAEATGVAHLVVASSVGVYGHHPDDPSQRVDESWPLKAVASLEYSRSKVAVEFLLDGLEARRPGLKVTRVRPGLVLQHAAGSEIANYFLGPLVPTRGLLGVSVPALPMPRALAVQAVHARDLADAYTRVVESGAPGAFNVATEPVLTGLEVARALGARRAVPVSRSAVRGLAALSFRAHLHPTAPGWLDMAYAIPVMDTNRARSELGWEPQVSSVEALGALLSGMRDHAGTTSASLLPRSAPSRVGTSTQGP
jgi:nucleoside-diphosphate-sugar epimerase